MGTRLLRDANEDLWIWFDGGWICVTDPKILQRIRDKLHGVLISQNAIEKAYGPVSELRLVEAPCTPT